MPTPARPAAGPGGEPVPVVVVPDWTATFQVPPDAQRALAPWPVWLAPAAVLVGLALVAALGTAGAPWQALAVLGALGFVAAWVAIALAAGPRRLDGVAYAVAYAAWAWIWFAGIGAAGDDARSPFTFAIAAGGLVGGLISTSRARRSARLREDAVRHLREGDGGTRIEAWAVARTRSLDARGVTLLAADGSERTWSAEYRGGQGFRPATGYPVAVWTATDGTAAVVLAPRDRTG